MISPPIEITEDTDSLFAFTLCLLRLPNKLSLIYVRNKMNSNQWSPECPSAVLYDRLPLSYEDWTICTIYSSVETQVLPLAVR